MRLRGEGGEVNLVEAEKKMEGLRDELSVKGFAVENVFYMDETGIFFRALQSTSFEVLGSDKRQPGRGTKALSAKDRVTLLFSVNATGTCKVTLLMIGSSKKPR